METVGTFCFTLRSSEDIQMRLLPDAAASLLSTFTSVIRLHSARSSNDIQMQLLPDAAATLRSTFTSVESPAAAQGAPKWRSQAFGKQASSQHLQEHRRTFCPNQTAD